MVKTSVDVRDGVAIVTPPGDVDLETTAALRVVLICLLYKRSASHVIVDLRWADFLDLTGIGVLVAARRAGLRRGVTVRVANTGPLVRAVLRMVGLYDTLTWPPTPAVSRNAGEHFHSDRRMATNDPARRAGARSPG